MIFSERLKEEREKRNWSQNDLAEKIHVSRQSVSKWETGKNYPSIEIIIHLTHYPKEVSFLKCVTIV
ncbi:helix-turn-helix transcriptional regulator [Bacillus thuringiensis serovar andalousiensis]|uniref:Helix-turn-helix transcriptional regulator n=1 Tax=Bacillus thuringiensis serovar andalousiensis TaxID=257985 RepID=A0A6H0TL90_BACTU|nr:helix-turn-helix transcriptional regulator [Bacillus thuringiensis serovar andalousiensis]